MLAIGSLIAFNSPRFCCGASTFSAAGGASVAAASAVASAKNVKCKKQFSNKMLTQHKYV